MAVVLQGHGGEAPFEAALDARNLDLVAFGVREERVDPRLGYMTPPGKSPTGLPFD